MTSSCTGSASPLPLKQRKGSGLTLGLCGFWAVLPTLRLNVVLLPSWSPSTWETLGCWRGACFAMEGLV